MRAEPYKIGTLDREVVLDKLLNFLGYGLAEKVGIAEVLHWEDDLKGEDGPGTDLGEGKPDVVFCPEEKQTIQFTRLELAEMSTALAVFVTSMISLNGETFWERNGCASKWRSIRGKISALIETEISFGMMRLQF